MLYPEQNAFRTIHDLGGFWNFRPDPAERGIGEGWFQHPFPKDSLLIAVPGAWNEQLAECGLMNFVGCGWYETTFVVHPVDPSTHRMHLRIGAADHKATVWMNGIWVGEHEGGYLPFEIDLTAALHTLDEPQRLTICVDSRLSMTTLPQGIDPHSPPYDRPVYDRRHVFPPTRFDFFPYGGLTRSVQILRVPSERITGVFVKACLDGTVTMSIEATGHDTAVSIRLFDSSHTQVATMGPLPMQNGMAQGTTRVQNPHAWSPASPNLYTAEIRLHKEIGSEIDRYEESFGFREIRIDGGTILFNNEPLYLVGFGKHEDYPVLGRGLFRAAYLRDFELMRWAGANSFRTSHYPYDEEIMRLADRMGFLVIDEVPAVSLGFLSDKVEDLAPLLQTHCAALTDLIRRDRNHPSVIAWSITNEPNLWSEPLYQNDASRQYFRRLYDHVKTLDAGRPVMAIAIPALSEKDVALEACDVIGINRYYAWYTEPADLAKAQAVLGEEMERIFAHHGKPIVVTECGADTIEGLHATTAQMFTEEYQTEFLRVYSAVADAKPFCAGLHVWNFADFLTPQHYRRVVLNKKGVFTRTREPKSAAFFLRSHWIALHRVASAHRPARHSDTFLVPDVVAPQ